MEDEKRIDHNSEDVMAADVASRRSEVVQGFKLDFSVDDIPDVEPSPATTEEPPVREPVALATMSEREAPPKKAVPKKKKQNSGCLKKLLYALFILIVSGALIFASVVFLFDCLALGKESRLVDVEIPSGANTEQIAELLYSKGLIEQPLCFRLFSRLTGADGKYQVGAFVLSPDMGYAAMVELLQTMTPRETATVTIPEGFTVEEIAKLLEENGICEKDSFYDAVINGEFDYDFVRDIPTAADGDRYAGRIYRLEGYLFPDTYNFYLGSSGETVVGRMLENFNNKLTPDLRQAITAKGWTVDQAIIMASIVEGEAAKEEDMYKVSKVLENRLQPDSGYPKLELCSTRDYVANILPSVGGIEVTSIAYNTYKREGLPVGAINNPGLMALKAALNPSTDEDMTGCYFFATDYDTGITYFSKTFSQHEKICRKYGIGMYG
ncbi:MAG: endolytic transglycosylase MltG [Clostridia bacterium]|nr:endolytic transglycosylase MltG [Clostridia bacterium]